VVPGKLAAARARASEALIKSVEWALALDEKQRPQSVAQWKRAILGEAPVARPVPVVAPAAARTAPRPPRREAEKPARSAWRWLVIGILLTMAVAWVAPWRAARAPEKVSAPRIADGAARDRPSRERAERPGIEDADFEQLRVKALREFKAADANGDGFLSPDEVRRFPYIAKEFARVDADGDGRISPPEFVRVRRLQAQKKPLE
jgi:hypothetical protein